MALEEAVDLSQDEQGPDTITVFVRVIGALFFYFGR